MQKREHRDAAVLDLHLLPAAVLLRVLRHDAERVVHAEWPRGSNVTYSWTISELPFGFHIAFRRLVRAIVGWIETERICLRLLILMKRKAECFLSSVSYIDDERLNTSGSCFQMFRVFNVLNWLISWKK